MGERAEDQLLETAKSLHDQAEYLLNDEIRYADSLRDSRKIATTLVLLGVGIGVFRFELFRPAGHVLTVPVWVAWTVKALLVTAPISFLISAYLVYTERGLGSELRPPKDGVKTGGALSALRLSQLIYSQYLEKSPLEVMRMRTDQLRLAYDRLKQSNRRVRKRIAFGTGFAFLGLFLVLLAFAFYTLSVDLPGAGIGGSP